MAKIALDDFVSFVRKHEGRTIVSRARSQKFKVRVLDYGFEFTPTRTQKPRSHKWPYIERVLAKYRQTGSLLTTDYQFTVNATYQLTLIAMYVESDKAVSRSINVEEHDLTKAELDDAIRKARLCFGIVPTDSQLAQNRQRRGQKRIRELTLENYERCCAVCDVTDRNLLVASHIVGWAEDAKPRGNLSNVICLCRIHDALFEAGYWALGKNFEVLRKKSIRSTTVRQSLDAMTSFRMPREFTPGITFLKRHRNRTGFKV